MTNESTATVAVETTKAAKNSNPMGVTKRTNAYFIDPMMVGRREGWNPRFDFGETEALAISIRANGVLNPIRVKRLATPTEAGHVFELLDGDRRLTAIELICKKDSTAFPDGIPAIIVDKAQDDKTSFVQMFEANSGKTFLPLEEAAAYLRMRDEYKMSIKAICAATGKASVHVTEILNLANADESVKDAVATGKIGKTMAKQISTAAKGDKAKQKELVAQASTAKASTDKNAKKAVRKQIDNTKVAKAKAKGKTLKIRALDDVALSLLGGKMAEMLSEVMKAEGIAFDADLNTWVKNNAKYTMAYAFGALEALKAAAGDPKALTL